MGMREDLSSLMSGLGTAAKKLNDDLEARFDAKLEALEQRLSSGINLADSYEGTHNLGKTYGRGKLVTHKGSLWLCKGQTNERPGESSYWQLIVKGSH